MTKMEDVEKTLKTFQKHFGALEHVVAISAGKHVVVDGNDVGCRRVERISYGQTMTYSEVAQALGRPKAYRAVGNANAANPLSLVIPCHRVVAAGGKLGGYGGGTSMKKRLLMMERERRATGDFL